MTVKEGVSQLRKLSVHSAISVTTDIALALVKAHRHTLVDVVFEWADSDPPVSDKKVAYRSRTSRGFISIWCGADYSVRIIVGAMLEYEGRLDK